MKFDEIDAAEMPRPTDLHGLASALADLARRSGRAKSFQIVDWHVERKSGFAPWIAIVPLTDDLLDEHAVAAEYAAAKFTAGHKLDFAGLTGLRLNWMYQDDRGRNTDPYFSAVWLKKKRRPTPTLDF